MICIRASHFCMGVRNIVKTCVFIMLCESNASCNLDIRNTDMKWIFASNIVDVSSYEELKAAISDGKWARGPWSARSSSFLCFSLWPFLWTDMFYRKIDRQPLLCLIWVAFLIVSCSDKDELKVKEETGATIRCFPFEQPQGAKTCLMTGNAAEEVAIFAKSY